MQFQSAITVYQIFGAGCRDHFLSSRRNKMFNESLPLFLYFLDRKDCAEKRQYCSKRLGEYRRSAGPNDNGYPVFLLGNLFTTQSVSWKRVNMNRLSLDHQHYRKMFRSGDFIRLVDLRIIFLKMPRKSMSQP